MAQHWVKLDLGLLQKVINHEAQELDVKYAVHNQVRCQSPVQSLDLQHLQELHLRLIQSIARTKSRLPVLINLSLDWLHKKVVRNHKLPRSPQGIKINHLIQMLNQNNPNQVSIAQLTLRMTRQRVPMLDQTSFLLHLELRGIRFNRRSTSRTPADRKLMKMIMKLSQILNQVKANSHCWVNLLQTLAHKSDLLMDIVLRMTNTISHRSM